MIQCPRCNSSNVRFDAHAGFAWCHTCSFGCDRALESDTFRVGTATYEAAKSALVEGLAVDDIRRGDVVATELRGGTLEVFRCEAGLDKPVGTARDDIKKGDRVRLDPATGALKKEP